MKKWFSINEMDAAAHAIRSRSNQKPRVGLILGSGLGSLADEIQSPDIIAYSDIPDFPMSTVAGHVGRLVIGDLEGQCVMVMQGRAHYYEGYSMAHVTFPVRVMQRLGVEALIVTNAAGAINPDYEPGDVMIIKDHIGLIGMTGNNPLRGPNIDELGQRFPDMSQAYDREYIQIVREVATENHIAHHEGVYASLSGPSFETPADLRFLRIIGADAVGMSTAPEVIVARHGGTRVLGLSGISNKANLDGSTLTTHEEVLAAGKMIVPKLTTLIRGVLRKMD